MNGMNADRLTIDAYCKINISLDIKGIRDDGYHDVEMILQTIPLCDHITLRKGAKRKNASYASKAATLRSNAEWLPCDGRNTALKAAVLLAEDFGRIDTETEIYIDKKIPRCGGLGGSSADAAAVLIGMNRLYDLKLTYEDLCRYAARIGSDVPFLLKYGAAVATGTGTELKYIEPFTGGILLLVNPNIQVSTPEAYKKYDLLDVPESERPDTGKVIRAMKGSAKELGAVIKNVLEYTAFSIYPCLAELKKELALTDPDALMMSGSGATFYAVYSKEHIKRAVGTARHYAGRGYFTYICPI